MNKKPSKYDNAIFSPPKTETDPAQIQRSILGDMKHENVDTVAASIASEVRDWLKSDDSKSKSATETGGALLQRCETLRQDFARVEETGLRKGPPSAVSLIDFGYHHCQWRIQAYGLERFAGIGRQVDGNLLRSKGQPITEQAIALFKNGAAIREVERQCAVNYKVARKWKKEFDENS